VTYLEFKEGGQGVWPFCKVMHKFWCFSSGTKVEMYQCRGGMAGCPPHP